LQPDAIYWYSVAETWTTPVPQNRRTRVCIFANNEPSGFYYLGEGWIAGLGFDYKPANTRCLYCRITPKLPRHLWTKFGGYAHWLLTIGDKEFQVAGVEEAMTLIERNWHKSTKELYLTRYERDQLNALVNEKGEAMVRYLQLEPQKELYSGTFDWNSDRTSFVRFSGDEWEVPSSTVVSRALAIDLIKSFLARGRPVGLSPVAG